MWTFVKLFPMLWMTLLIRRIHAQNYEQRSSTFDALFQFQVVQGSGNMTSTEIQAWEDASSDFFAKMFDQLNDNRNLTTPMLAPGVIITVTQQDRYVASTGNFGSVNYGVSLEVTFVVTFQTPPEAPNINAGQRVFSIFDEDEKGNLIFFSPYLFALRRQVGTTFKSVNRMSINVNSPQLIDLQSPIPTLPLPPPTDAPTIRPTSAPTATITASPSQLPTLSTPTPTGSPSSVPTIVATTTTPTMAPTTSNPTAPDETLRPTAEPNPTVAPTKSPTGPPTLPLESFFATSKLLLVVEAPTNLDFNATLDFQIVTSNYLSIIIQDLLPETLVEDVRVALSSQTLVEPKTTTEKDNTRRRRLQDDKKEEEPSKLQVEFNTILKIRSTTSVNAPSLVQSAFGTAGRRENYRLLLVASGDPILETITLVQLADGNTNIDDRTQPMPVTPSEGGLSTAGLVGIAVGAVIFAIAILGIWYKANNAKKSDDGDSQKGQISTAQMSEDASGLKGRLDAEIVVDKNADDVSTLGDPFFFGVPLEERTCADKTATSASVQQSYDFMKLMNKGPSALLGTTAEDIDEEEETASKVRRNTLFADDDASFEDMFGEMQ